MVLVGEVYAAVSKHVGADSDGFSGYVSARIGHVISVDVRTPKVESREKAVERLLDVAESCLGVPRHAVQESLDRGMAVDLDVVVDFLPTSKTSVR